MDHGFPYTYGFRALYFKDGEKKADGIRAGEVPAEVILTNPVQAVQDALDRSGMTGLVVRDAWLMGDAPIDYPPMVG